MDESDKLESIPGREDKMAATVHGLVLKYVIVKLKNLPSRAAVSNFGNDEKIIST